MRRRDLLLAALAPAALAAVKGKGTLLLTAADAVALKLLASTNDPRAEALRKTADSALTKGPWSVTEHRPPAGMTKAGPHDFYSEGPYWWPDPANPTGPWIRRDGQTNPDRFTRNDQDMKTMCDAVLALGAASYLFDKPEYAKRAAKIISVWFLDEPTRMTPNLQFGQAVRGRAEGRPEGLIATRAFIWLLEGVRLAERSDAWDAQVSSGLKTWMHEFLAWMTTSDIGKGEGASSNNHASWWTATGSAIAIYAGDNAARDRMFDHYRSSLLKHVNADGSAPKEEARTKSLDYSLFNATAMAMIARLAQVQGKDLANQTAKNGANLYSMVRYLAPFLLNPSKWPGKQITPPHPDREFLAGLASLVLKQPEFARVQRQTGLTGGPSADFLSLLFETSL